MKLELTSLEKAVSALERSINAVSVNAGSLSPEIMEVLQAGIIQHFEVAYEQCWKTMKRWIENNVGAEIADGVTRRELFRLAVESRLIVDVDRWMTYHAARNETSHVYNQETANEVGKRAVEFLAAAKEFVEAIRARND